MTDRKTSSRSNPPLIATPGRWLGFALLALAIVLVCSKLACSRKDTPEAQIRALIDRAQAAAEAKDLDGLQQLIAADYTDKQGHDKKALRRLLGVYLLGHQSIHVFTRIKELTVETDQATATVLVGMAGRPVSTTEELHSLHADLYRLHLQFASHADVWQIISADWQPADPGEFL